MRITAAAPAAMVDDCNDLAMCLAYGPSDGQTYRGPGYQDALGNLYAVASWEAGPDFVAAVTSPLDRPVWDTGTLDEDTGEYGAPYIVNMTGAERAQAALVFWDGNGDTPQAVPGKLTAVLGPEGPDALRMMGLMPVPYNGGA